MVVVRVRVLVVMSRYSMCVCFEHLFSLQSYIDRYHCCI